MWKTLRMGLGSMVLTAVSAVSWKVLLLKHTLTDKGNQPKWCKDWPKAQL